MPWARSREGWWDKLSLAMPFSWPLYTDRKLAIEPRCSSVSSLALRTPRVIAWGQPGAAGSTALQG